MNVRIKRIEKDLPLPEYQTGGSVAFDLYARKDVTIGPKENVLIPTNIIVETPPGYMLMVALRSSTPGRKGLMKSNGVGIIDQDYAGEEDEVLMQVYNFTDKEVEVKRGERVGQAMFVRIDKAEFDEVSHMNEESRGGVGSTGY